MVQAPSEQDVIFLRHFNKYLNVFLITPWLFDKKTFKKSMVSKLYGSFLIMCVVFWLYYVLQDDHFLSTLQLGLVSQQIITVLRLTVLLTLTCLTIIKSGFYDCEKWRLLFDNFSVLDKHLQGVIEEKKIVKFYGLNFAKHLVYLTQLGHFLWINSTSAKVSLLKSILITPFIYYYYEFLTVCLLVTVLEVVKNRYKYLNKKLLILTTKSEFVQEANNTAKDYQILNESV